MKAKHLLQLITLTIALLGLAVNGQTLPTEIFIDPTATYLLVNTDPATNASPIDLKSYGISPGDILRLTVFGDFNNGTGNFRNGMTGVFSSNSVLLAQSQLNRVPGAIATGTPYATPAAFHGSLPTDIPQDFIIQLPQQPPFSTTNISIRVPAGAAFLFVSAIDSLYYDNIDDATNNFRVLLESGTEIVLTISIASSNSVRISWNTDSNQLYQLQTSKSPSGSWTNLGTPALGMGSKLTITNPTIGQQAAFYRVARVP
jgi:hypothetical protein